MPQSKQILAHMQYCTSMACLLKRYDSSYTQDKMLDEVQPVTDLCFDENNPSRLIDLSKALEARIDKLEKENPSILFSEEAEEYIKAIKQARENLENQNSPL